MFSAILFTHWKWVRFPLMFATIGGFALPILSVQRAGDPIEDTWRAALLLRSVESWSVWYSALAAGIGLLVATSAWASDHRGMHVYALSLPVDRWRYVLLRFGGGLLLLAPTVIALWLGAILAVAFVELPLGLRAYPSALAMRFALAALVSFGIFFAVSSGTARTAGYVLVVIIGVVAAHLLLNAAGAPVDLIERVLRGAVNWPGPLEVFTGRWMLIDV